MSSIPYFVPHCWQRGKYTGILEEALANYLSASYAFGFASEGVAFRQVLKGWGIGAGDDVVVSAYGSPFVVQAIRQAKAVPLFVDIEDDTFNLDYRKLEYLMTGRTRAVIISHTFGQVANLGKIVPWARGRAIKVIEDCTQALGGRYRGELLGTFGDAALFSFGCGGTPGAIGGGAVVTSDPRLGRALGADHRRLSFPSKRLIAKSFFDVRLSMDAPQRLPNIWAAVAYRRFVEIDDCKQRQREAAGCYLQRLRDLSPLRLPRTEEGAESSFRYFAIQVPDPERLLRAVRRSGVTLVHWDGNASSVEDCPVANGIVSRVVLLPTLVSLVRARKVVKVVREHYLGNQVRPEADQPWAGTR